MMVVCTARRMYDGSLCSLEWKVVLDDATSDACGYLDADRSVGGSLEAANGPSVLACFISVSQKHPTPRTLDELGIEDSEP